jgi:cob(I)alamin adenosyltransferase
MKIYTRTGDDGTTGLFAGGRVSKSHPRVACYGTVDELNSVLGLARSATEDNELDEWLSVLQNDLFCLGADLATPMTDKPDKPHVLRLDAGAAVRLEAVIDECEDDLPPLVNFILPGGCPAAAHLHHARCVARRAERQVVAFAATEVRLNAEIVVYLNRLSDLLFVLGRWANHRSGADEVIWKR